MDWSADTEALNNRLANNTDVNGNNTNLGTQEQPLSRPPSPTTQNNLTEDCNDTGFGALSEDQRIDTPQTRSEEPCDFGPVTLTPASGTDASSGSHDPALSDLSSKDTPISIPRSQQDTGHPESTTAAPSNETDCNKANEIDAELPVCF